MPCAAGEFHRRQILESLVSSTLIVLNTPRLQFCYGLVHRFGPVDVQAFIPEPSVERLDEVVVGPLTRPVEFYLRLVMVRSETK